MNCEKNDISYILAVFVSINNVEYLSVLMSWLFIFIRR